jgi:hypothetical protein
MPIVNGTAQDVTREEFAGLIVFENLSVPAADGARVTCSAITEVNLQDSDDGAFSVELAPGLYKLTVDGRSRKFPVPKGNGEYNLATLLASAPASVTPAQTLLQWAMGNQFVLSDIERDSGEVVTSATITWPDGSSGIYSMTIKNEEFNDADAWTMTHSASGYTVTQPTLTRDQNGFVIDEPVPIIS